VNKRRKFFSVYGGGNALLPELQKSASVQFQRVRRLGMPVSWISVKLSAACVFNAVATGKNLFTCPFGCAA